MSWQGAHTGTVSCITAPKASFPHRSSKSITGASLSQAALSLVQVGRGRAVPSPPSHPAPLPELGLCTMRYSGAPWQPLRSSTHVAVRTARGCFFAAFRGKLVTPRLLSHGSAAGGHRGQPPTPANTHITVATGFRPRATTAISPRTYHSPQHQALGRVFQTASERRRPAPSPPAWGDRNEDRLIYQPTLSPRMATPWGQTLASYLPCSVLGSASSRGIPRTAGPWAHTRLPPAPSGLG